MWRTLKADERVELAFTLNNMAYVLMVQGKLPEAEAKQREALQVQRKVFGNKHKDVAISLVRLGLILRDRRQLAGAETSLREALEIWRELQTPDRPEFADTLHDLGKVLIEQDKFAQAETNLAEAVAMRRRLFGNEHPDVGDSLHFLAFAQDSQGKVDEAVTAVREALAIYSKLHTNDCSEVAQELNNLGFDLAQQGELAQAETILKRAVAMRKNVFGSVNVEVARSLNNLTTVLRMEGKLAEAETVLRNDLEVLQWLGEENLVRTRFVDLANLLTREGKPAEAESFLNQVLSREPHVSVASHLISQAAMTKQQRHPDCPERCNYLLRCAWEILLRLPSEDLAKLPGEAVCGLVDGGFKQQATNVCWRMLDSSSTNAAWFNEASWFLATAENPASRDPALALELAQRATRLSGDANYWNTLGVARYRAGDFKQALADLEKSAQLDHDRTSFNSFFIAMAYKQLGDTDSGRRLYAQAVEWMEKKAPQNPELLRFRTEAEHLFGP
jgi:tetratricopeptide (TPR) repeat protein